MLGGLGGTELAERDWARRLRAAIREAQLIRRFAGDEALVERRPAFAELATERICYRRTTAVLWPWQKLYEASVHTWDACMDAPPDERLQLLEGFAWPFDEHFSFYLYHLRMLLTGGALDARLDAQVQGRHDRHLPALPRGRRDD